MLVVGLFKQNYLFDLDIKGEGHSNLIFIYDTLSCPKIMEGQEK